MYYPMFSFCTSSIVQELFLIQCACNIHVFLSKTKTKGNVFRQYLWYHFPKQSKYYFKLLLLFVPIVNSFPITNYDPTIQGPWQGTFP